MYAKITFFILFIKSMMLTCLSSSVRLNTFLVDPASDPTFADRGTVRIAKQSRTQLVVSGTAQAFQNIGNDVVYTYEIYFQNPITKNFDKLLSTSKPFCDFLNEDTILVPQVREASNLPEKGVCPLPKGPITVNNFMVEISENLPLPKGEYYLKVFMQRDGRMLISARFDFTVE